MLTCGWRVASKPGQAPPPPTGTAARPSYPSGALHTSGAWRADVWLARQLEARPGPVGQVARLSETAIAFARSYLCEIETAIAFAGEKWAFLVHFSGAEVMPVSRLPGGGRAVVLLVSTSLCCRASCAKKFAQRTRNAPKLAFCGVLGEFFRGNAAGGGVLGELCRAVGLAAEPFYWRPADTQLNPIGGMVGRPPRPPPSGLTCG